MVLRIIALLFMCFIFAQSEFLILYSGSENRPNTSAMNEIIKLNTLAKDTSLSFKFKGVPWSRALLMIEKGLADGLLNASYKENRAQYSVYPTKNGKLDNTKKLNSGQTYYIYKNMYTELTWDGTKFSDSYGIVGAQNNYAVVDDLKKHNNVEVVTKSNIEQLFSDLVKSKIDAIAMIERELENIQKKFPNLYILLEKQENPIRQKNYFMIF